MRIHPLEFVKQNALHRAHVTAHVSYLVLCFVESHGMYGIAAGALSIVVVVQESIELHRHHKVVKGGGIHGT